MPISVFRKLCPVMFDHWKCFEDIWLWFDHPESMWRCPHAVFWVRVTIGIWNNKKMIMYHLHSGCTRPSTARILYPETNRHLQQASHGLHRECWPLLQPAKRGGEWPDQDEVPGSCSWWSQVWGYTPNICIRLASIITSK